MVDSEPPPSSPPGWYPVAEGGKRFWDGREWTSVVVGVPEQASVGTPGDRAVPAAVNVGFWLWWPLIVAHGLVLALCVYRIVEASVVMATIPFSGPSAGWAYIILGPTALVTGAFLAVELSQVVRLRRGRSDARVALVVLAILNVAVVSALSVGLQPALQYDPQQIGTRIVAGLLTALAGGAVLAVIASLMPFHRSAKEFFARTSAMPRPYETPTGGTTKIGERG